MLRTEIGYTTPDRITVRGRDLAGELIGNLDFVEMFVLIALGRVCTREEKEAINAIMVTTADHGLTPSALATRLTYTGAPESPQAAVAAGLLGAGSVFLGAMKDATEMLADAGEGLTVASSAEEISTRAETFVAARRTEGRPLYGFGHNIHVHGDPRVPVLREVAERNGFRGLYWRLLEALEVAAGAARGRPLPINAAGAIAALILEMGLPASMARGITLVARCAGLVGHLIEEEQQPLGRELWDLVLRQDARNELP